MSGIGKQGAEPKPVLWEWTAWPGDELCLLVSRVPLVHQWGAQLVRTCARE